MPELRRSISHSRWCSRQAVFANPALPHLVHAGHACWLRHPLDGLRVQGFPGSRRRHPLVAGVPRRPRGLPLAAIRERPDEIPSKAPVRGDPAYLAEAPTTIQAFAISLPAPDKLPLTTAGISGDLRRFPEQPELPSTCPAPVPRFQAKLWKPLEPSHGHQPLAGRRSSAAAPGRWGSIRLPAVAVVRPSETAAPRSRPARGWAIAGARQCARSCPADVKTGLCACS